MALKHLDLPDGDAKLRTASLPNLWKRSQRQEPFSADWMLNIGHLATGLIRFGWEGGFSVDGVEIQLHDYPRYENPFSRTGFNADEVRIAAGEHELIFELGN